jgi:hypothetical protein
MRYISLMNYQFVWSHRFSPLWNKNVFMNKNLHEINKFKKSIFQPPKQCFGAAASESCTYNVSACSWTVHRSATRCRSSSCGKPPSSGRWAPIGPRSKHPVWNLEKKQLIKINVFWFKSNSGQQSPALQFHQIGHGVGGRRIARSTASQQFSRSLPLHLVIMVMAGNDLGVK